MRKSGGTQRRFEAGEIHDDVIPLGADHWAIKEGRSLFKSTVVDPMDSGRLFVSGRNSPKLGSQVEKGPLKGFPIYQLTLEERATCPPSCAVWRWCYGNAMPFARRHDHSTPEFLALMRAEIALLARAHPQGFLVRLHVLGDFFSVEYVRTWADLLDEWPQLHVFGFTARSETADDPESRTIAKALRWLTEQAWDRFAIRFSRAHPEPQGSVVVDADPHQAGVIVCPAQTHKTDACATCGLCWSPAAREKTIAFLRHGMRRPGRKKGSRHTAESRANIGAKPRHFVKHPVRREPAPVIREHATAAEALAHFDPMLARVLGKPFPKIEARS